MRAVLMRLVPPASLASLVLPAVLARAVMPSLAKATILPSSTTYSFSSAIAPVVALWASADSPISHGSELLTFVGVVGVEVVVHAISAALG